MKNASHLSDMFCLSIHHEQPKNHWNNRCICLEKSNLSNHHMNSHAACDIPFTLVSDTSIFTPTHWCFIGVLHASHQVLKDQQDRPYTANKQGGTGHCSGCNHFPSPLPPNKNTKSIPRHPRVDLLRRYLDPQNVPKTPSQEVIGCLGVLKNAWSEIL